MSRCGLLIEAVLVGVVVFVLVILSAVSIKASYEEQKLRGQLRLQKTTVTIIERAHHMKDELSIQEAVYGLGKAPGVLLACVVGNDHKILAHSQPSELGQPYHHSSFPVTACPLLDGQEAWGHLIFALSNRSLHDAWLRQVACWLFGGVLLWIAWMARTLYWNQRLQKRDRLLSDLSAVGEEQKQTMIRENEKQTQRLAQSLIWLQSAVGRLPQGLVLLDQRQRVTAINGPAAQRLGMDRGDLLLGKSWTEIPILQTCGIALERSLAFPGQAIEALAPGDCKLSFETQGAEGFTGTWISFI